MFVFSLALSLVTAFVMLLAVFRYVEPFYARFTTQEQSVMAFGTSRVAQGIVPEVLNGMGISEQPFFNYAFTVAHSPYGPAYYESIRKKLKPTRNGVFILGITPWSIAGNMEYPNDSTKFREIGACVATTQQVCQWPNFEYFFENYDQPQQTVTIPFLEDNPSFLHGDGWLEVTANMDVRVVENRLKAKLASYKRNMLPNYTFSSLRLRYFLKTIELLKPLGKVYLVRIPIHPKMMELENKFMPNFDKRIQAAVELSDGYYDLTPRNSDFEYTDGNHLYKESSKKVTQEIASWIEAMRQ